CSYRQDNQGRKGNGPRRQSERNADTAHGKGSDDCSSPVMVKTRDSRPSRHARPVLRPMRRERVMKSFILTLVCALPLSVMSGQSTAATPEPLFPAVKGAFFALSVPDLGASARWYAEKFGLKRDMESQGAPFSVVVLSGNGLTVELIHNDNAAPLGKDVQLVQGIVKAGLVVDDLDKVIGL